jgi:cell division protein FtsI (penicillin-binding protein 3)
MPKKEKNKFYFLYFLFLFAFLLLGVRYFEVQVLLDDDYFKKLLSKYADVRYIKLPGWRGVIYTSDGIPTAITVNKYVYYALTDKLTPEEIKIYAESFDKVFDVPANVIYKTLLSYKGYVDVLKVIHPKDRNLDTNPAVFNQFLKVRQSLWRKEQKYLQKVFGRKILSREKILQVCQNEGFKSNHYLFEVCKIQKVLDWTGVSIANKRIYPHGRFLANTLGYVDYLNRGKAGVELMEDKDLYGGPVKIPYLHGAKYLKLIDLPAYKLFEKNLTADVYLTIDYTIQAILEDEKDRIADRWHPKKVVIMLMNAYTGKILGLAVYPDFNPNKPFRNWQEYMNSKNPAFMEAFEMGSVIKPFFVGLALYKGRIKPTDKVYIDHGRTYIGRHVVRDAERLPFQYLSVRDVLVHSSNVGVVQIARKLKKEEERWLINQLQWNRKIVDFPGATAGLVPNLNLPANRLYIAFGQGLALTPAHLVSSYAALLTGYAPKPQLIEKVVREDGKVLKTFKPQYLNNEPIFDEKTRKWLLNTLRQIVVRGTGTKANPYYYIVGGKTGTAQVYDKKLHRYSSKRYVTSFIGFFPYPDPKYVLLVMVDEPKAPRRYLLYGGTVAAPYWADIVNRVCSYLGIEPSPDLNIFKRRKH